MPPDTYSEAWRHYMECKQVAEWGRTNPARARRHLELVAEKRGEAAARKLREDAMKLFREAA